MIAAAPRCAKPTIRPGPAQTGQPALYVLDNQAARESRTSVDASVITLPVPSQPIVEMAGNSPIRALLVGLAVVLTQTRVL